MRVKVQGVEELRRGIYYEYETNSLPLGQGGMGTVYQGYCFQESTKEVFIPVALKKISKPNPDLITRAMFEASVQVDHPNLLLMFGFIQNFEFDPVSKSPVLNYYIAMEDLRGVNLDDLMKGSLKDKFGVECKYAKELYGLYKNDRFAFARKILTSVLDGAKALHDAGYIHRDIDPSNIMVTHDGQIKLIDYGISGRVSERSKLDRKLTAPGAKMGKIDYSAPEMMSGSVEKHNFTTDIYSIGIMAYQLCVGSLPFTGSVEEVLTAHLTTPVPVENISDSVLRKCIEKATQKDQALRYQSVGAFIEDLAKGITATGNGNQNTAQGAGPDTVNTKESHSIPAWLWSLVGIAGIAIGVFAGMIVF